MSRFKHQYKTVDDSSLINLKVHNIGFELCDPNHNFSGLREFFSIHFIVSGCGTYTVNDNTYNLSSGDIFIVYPNTLVSYTADNDNPWEYYWLGMSGEYVKSLLSLTDFSKQKPYISSDASSDLKPYLMEIYDAQGQTYANEVEMIGRAYVFLSKIMAMSSVNKENQGENYAKKAKDIIDLNYAENLSTEEIAKSLNISRSQLHRVFTERYSISVGKYINKLRLERSCFLLKNTKLRINEISSSVGFENQLYFSNAFKKSIGISPTQYRNKL